MKIKTKSTREKVKQAISLHEKMKKAYFLQPPWNASSRRYYEKNNSMSFAFRFQGTQYDINLKTDCSCKNVYYRSDIFVDGIKKNISALKKII